MSSSINILKFMEYKSDEGLKATVIATHFEHSTVLLLYMIFIAFSKN